MEALHNKLINYTSHWYFRHLGRCLAFLAIVLIKLWHQKKYLKFYPKLRVLHTWVSISFRYVAGNDNQGRPVLVFIGKWFRSAEFDTEKAVMYLIKLLHQLVTSGQDYVRQFSGNSRGCYFIFSFLYVAFVTMWQMWMWNPNVNTKCENSFPHNFF